MRHRDTGNASLEFIGVSVLLMVPIAYAIIAFAQVQQGVYGIHGAAEMATRAYLLADTDATGRYAAGRSAAIAGRNHGLLIASSAVHVECGAADCLVPGTHGTVSVDGSVRITVAPFTRTVPLHAAHSFTVEAYRQVTP